MSTTAFLCAESLAAALSMEPCLSAARRAVIVLVAAVCCGSVELPKCLALDVYHIGNSLTAEFKYRLLTDHWAPTFSRREHILFGSSLTDIWNNPDTSNRPPGAEGMFANALPNYSWNVLTLEPHASDFVSDLSAIENFVNLLTTHQANRQTQVYLYQVWPNRTGSYGDVWNAPFAGGPTSGAISRDYYRRLSEAVRTLDTQLDKPILTIPTGEVFFEIAARVQAGTLPGLDDPQKLYRDQVHLDSLGSFVLATTYYATVYQTNPVGLPFPETDYNGNEVYDTEIASPWTSDRDFINLLNTGLGVELQRIVWQVVAGHRESGVKATGDFDGDGLVTADDYGRWRLNFDRGIADAAGYTAWLDKMTGSGQLQSVPEPGVAAFFVTWACGAIVWFRRRAT